MNFFTDYQTNSQGQPGAGSSTQGLQFSQYCQNIDPPAETMEMEQDGITGVPITGLDKYIDMDDDKSATRFKVRRAVFSFYL